MDKVKCPVCGRKYNEKYSMDRDAIDIYGKCLDCLGVCPFCTECETCADARINTTYCHRYKHLHSYRPHFKKAI